MHTWIAFLRGINVGGKNILPMKLLRNTLAELGLQNVRTYIQSGNIVFEATSRSASALQKKISTAISKEYDLSPNLLLQTVQDLETALAENPFAVDAKEPKFMHFFFLAEQPKANLFKELQELATPSEKLALGNKVLYLFAPDGIARSKVASQAEKILSTTTTARNLRTVQKVIDLAKN
ncbi:MAG: DUF1697 domain-containing protein [Pirellulaceae bacterium]